VVQLAQPDTCVCSRCHLNLPVERMPLGRSLAGRGIENWRRRAYMQVADFMRTHMEMTLRPLLRCVTTVRRTDAGVVDGEEQCRAYIGRASTGAGGIQARYKAIRSGSGPTY